MPVVQLQVYMDLDGRTITNSHFFVGDELGILDTADLASDVRDAYFSRLQVYMAPEWTFERVDARLVSTQASPFITVFSTPFAGTQTGDLLAHRSDICVQFERATPAPNRKRVHLGGFTEANNGGGYPGNGVVGAIANWANDLLAISSVNGHQAAYAIPRWTGQPAYVPLAYAASTYLISTVWGSLKSRLS